MYNSLLVSSTIPACPQDLPFQQGLVEGAAAVFLHFLTAKPLPGSCFHPSNAHLLVHPQTLPKGTCVPSLCHPSPKTFKIKTLCTCTPHSCCVQLDLLGELERSLPSPHCFDEAFEHPGLLLGQGPVSPDLDRTGPCCSQKLSA